MEEEGEERAKEREEAEERAKERAEAEERRRRRRRANESIIEFLILFPFRVVYAIERGLRLLARVTR